MIRAVYNWLGRAAYWLTVPGLLVMSLAANPRVRVVVVNESGQILLVKNWYGRQRWALPGGGVKFREPFVEAARRELHEELSLDIAHEDIRQLGLIDNYGHATPFQATLFRVEVSGETVIHRHPLELISHKWVRPGALPGDTHPSVARALDLWRG